MNCNTIYLVIKMIENSMGALSRSIVAGRVMESIRQDIICAKRKDGEKLTEEALASNYNISRGLARSILQQLHKEGMIKMLDNGCKQVIGFGANDAMQIYSLRGHIEISAVKQLFKMQKRNFSALIQVFDKVQSREVDLITLDLDFHRAVIGMAEDRFLLGAFDNIAPVLNTVFAMNVSIYAEQFKMDFFTTHNALLVPLLKGDMQESMVAFKTHIENAKNITLNAIAQLK